jgi:polysaccharide deacetylase family protein (PEP-CTERM system associated)
MLNALTVDVEDYFHVEAFASRIAYEDWDRFSPRIERNVARVLELLSRHGARATFFVLGWVAARHPALVREIADAGHELGCHGFAHRHIARQTPEQFRADVRLARMQIVDAAPSHIVAYRAPSFSIVERTFWALDILAGEGFEIDSSIFPVRHDLYGVPEAERFPHWIHTPAGNTLFEFPPSTVRKWNNNWGVCGGGYLRFSPYTFTRWAMRHINACERQPAIVYFHPWELDPAQPRLHGPWRSRLRHYTNLSTMENKIARMLDDFRFGALSDVCRTLRSYTAFRKPAVASTQHVDAAGIESLG